MKQYILLLLLILISVAQVAWGSFMVAFGIVVPILPIYIWWIYLYHKPNMAMWFAFIGGLVVDLLSASSLGFHAFVLLLALGVVILFNSRIAKDSFIANVITLLIIVAIYIAVPFYLG